MFQGFSVSRTEQLQKLTLGSLYDIAYIRLLSIIMYVLSIDVLGKRCEAHAVFQDISKYVNTPSLLCYPPEPNPHVTDVTPYNMIKH